MARLQRVAIAVVAIAFLLVASAANAQSGAELKLSVAVGSTVALGKAADRWAKRIAEKSNGRIAVKLYPGAALAERDPAREFVALAEGAADLAVGSTLFWSAAVKELTVVSLPWIAAGPRQLAALFEGDVAQTLSGAIERAGAMPLALAPLGFRALATRERVVQAPTDVAGLSVRVTAPQPVADVYAALGAEPKAMTFAEVEAALAAGRLDAQDGTLASFGAMRAHSLGFKRVLLWDAIGEGAVFAVNGKRWASWTEAERALVRDAAREVAAELATLARDDDEAALRELAKGGVTVARVTPSGRNAFVASTRSVHGRWAAIAGPDLVRRAEAAVAAAPP
jgi:TRAP-type C4-dicarboxylate transport system substrate-binding protein